MLFRFLILVHFCVAFPLKCPEPAQWSIRARSHCPDPSKYFCLKNDLINGYSENCTRFDFLKPGRKNVLRGGLDADICSSERYQPWPIIFLTNVSTNCIFRKSACHEEGQVVFDNGNPSTDATCRCDYTRRYDFIVKPRNPCFCVPSKEDCSCYLKKCHMLSPDYECIDSEEIMKINQCKPIIAERNDNEGNISDAENMVRGKQALTLEEYRTEATIFVTSMLSVVICVSFPFVVVIIASRWFKEYKIERLNTKETNEHLTASKDETEIRRYVRMQVIGKEGVGKSSPVRRLVRYSNTELNSRDGMDIVKCKIKTTDGEWVIGKVETERKKIIKRIQETLNKEQKQSESVSDQVIPSEEENGKARISSKEPLSDIKRERENHPQTVSIDTSLACENNVNIMNTSTSVAVKSNIDKPMKDNVVLATNDIQKSADKINAIRFEVKKNQDRMTSDNLVKCGVWDFAGQTDFYATYQTFLNPYDIYLFVTKISEEITGTVDETDFDSVEECIDFWLDSIHCLRTSSPGHGLHPPVIVVCTHIDEYKTEKEVHHIDTSIVLFSF